ncbi:MAG: ribonuclease III [Verrucomicrobiota bacterium]
MDFEKLQSNLGYTFQNAEWLRLAVTHPSVAHELGPKVQTNQRLEFLGDAVLGLVLTRELYEKFPQFSEGPLTKARAQMVNCRTLAQQARRFDLGEHLILSRGEQANLGRGRASALADAFEAVIGAIFLDGDYEAAKEFILRCFRDAFGELTVIPNLENPKGELQELLQANSPVGPEYELASVAGPDHDRDFESVVRHGGIELGRGKGKSKKLAESAAAAAALMGLKEKAETKNTNAQNTI